MEEKRPMPHFRNSGHPLTKGDRIYAHIMLAAMMALWLPLAGCERDAPPPEPDAIDVSGEAYSNDFHLTDHNGKTVRLSDFRGKIVALFFGFTQCPDVCPTTLAAFAEVYRDLGSDADRVQVLFVTIDPERDTQQLLAEYVPAFNARFIGLRGTPEETRRVADMYKVSYQKIPTGGDSYTLDHTAYVFIFDRAGHLRFKVPHGQPPAALTRLIRELESDT
ncbi:MAG: SCO family protein [Zoogloeaceae bacterium]|jgi:protein SCO1/2|nr:SCO family protein [Zoogloeaceae bacterium]